MATVKKGLTPFRKKGGAPFNGGRSRYLIKNSYGTALAEGDPVKVSDGFIEAATNVNATGVFAGCRYVNAEGQTVDSGLFPASTSNAAPLEGETHSLGFIYEGDDLTYLAVADASVSALLLGSTFPVSVGSPNTTLKRSNARVHASVNASADEAMVRVVGFPNIAGSRPDDANTIVEVELVSPTLVT